MTANGPAIPNTTEKVQWYCLGRPFLDAPDFLGPHCLKQIEGLLPGHDFKPTTWDAASDYLKRELEKPKGPGRDLLREMCMFHVLGIKSDQRIGFISESTDQIFHLRKGVTMMYPTVDLPPVMFGTTDQTSPVLIDMDTELHVPPGVVFILMAYITRTAKDIPRGTTSESANCFQLDCRPYE